MVWDKKIKHGVEPGPSSGGKLPRLRTLRKAYDLLTADEKRSVGLVVVLMLATAVLELTGVTSIFPFLRVLTDPSTIQENAWLSWTYTTLGFSSTRGFLLFLGSGVLGILLITQAVSAASFYVQTRWVWRINHAVSTRLLESYLSRPYSFFLQANTSELNKNVLHESHRVVQGIFQPALTVISQGMIALALISFLLLIEPVMTLVMLGTIGLAYVAVYLRLRRKMHRYGKANVEANRGRYKLSSESFDAVKEIKVLGRERQFLDRYVPYSQDYADYNARYNIASNLPSYLIRALAFGGLVGLLLGLLALGRPVNDIIPVIGVFAFAGYRMMPTFQKMLSAVAKFRYHEHLLDVLHDDLQEVDRGHPLVERSQSDPLPFETEVCLNKVMYRYPGTEDAVLQRIYLQIPKNQTVAIVGSTGAGKSTILNILLGLLDPDEGNLTVDGDPVEPGDIHRWQANIGYVPQEIYLTDDTIAHNIALGLPEDEIDKTALVRAARMAHIHEFISEKLPEGYETSVGERGVRLSGGQRQRIGIARALYHDPSFLVMDEATSDIDSETEANISRAIGELAGSKTMVVVAHRFSTIRNADKIAVIEDGRILALGTYTELLETSARFRALAQEVKAPA